VALGACRRFRRTDFRIGPELVSKWAGMGLLTVIRKNQRKEREMRVLFLCGKSPEAPQSALIPSQNSDA